MCTGPRSSGGYEVPYSAGNRTPIAQGAYRRCDTDNYSFLNYTSVFLAALTMEQGVLRKNGWDKPYFPLHKDAVSDKMHPTFSKAFVRI